MNPGKAGVSFFEQFPIVVFGTLNILLNAMVQVQRCTMPGGQKKKLSV